MGWREDVVSEAATWIGTPYRHRGRVKNVVVDCGGLLYECYAPAFGPFAPFPADYAADWAMHRGDELYLDFIRPHVTQVLVPKPGGFSVFRYGRAFCHAAIWTGSDYIHAWGRNGFGIVRRSPLAFFNLKCRGARPVKHFDAVDK